MIVTGRGEPSWSSRMIIAIAGPFGSGKSTLAAELARQLGTRSVGFGDFVRAKARRKGFNWSSRRVLQDLGQSLVDENPDDFLDDVLRGAGHLPGETLVLDGVRHVSIAMALAARQTAGSEDCLLIYLDLSASIRERRLAGRGMDGEAVKEADAHPAERDIHEGLREHADLALDGDLPTAALVGAIKAEFAARVRP